MLSGTLNFRYICALVLKYESVYAYLRNCTAESVVLPFPVHCAWMLPRGIRLHCSAENFFKNFQVKFF